MDKMILDNRIVHGDCMEMMKYLPENCVNFTLTDIPYNAVNRADNGLRCLNKEKLIYSRSICRIFFRKYTA